jgi:GT2 family glycosyltransferase
MSSTEVPHSDVAPPQATPSRPSASIVIPVHNKATITRQCLEALLREEDDGVQREIIVVDDGSSDLTPQVLAEYGDSIRVVRHESARGFATACNAGASAAVNEFIVLLNNDTMPTRYWLANLVAYAIEHPEAAIVGTKLLYPNDTIQHAGVVFGLDIAPHHLYAGFPADHPAAAVSRRFQAVTAACALFRRTPWQEMGGLSTDYQNGWEDVDYCLRVGEAGYEVHYCAESVVYHFESATRDLLSPQERANRALFEERWREYIVPDDFGYYWLDGLLSAIYGARYPIQLSVSPLLAGITVGDNDRLADRLLYDRARQVMILLRNNIVLNVRVQEAEARAAEAERRLAEALQFLASVPQTDQPRALSQPEEIPAAVASKSDNDEGDAAGEADTSSESTSQENGAAQGASAPPPLPHRIVGMVESPGRLPDVITDGVLIISGWALTESGDATVEAFVDGESRGAIPYGDLRPDAANLYPGYPAGGRCAFGAELSVADLADGMHDFVIRITGTAGEVAQLATTFEIDNHAFETGRVIGRIDQPVRGAPFVAREIAIVSGWALAPSGIHSVEVFIDGDPRGRIAYGALRPDIAKRRRQYMGADHCGFSGSIPLHGLDELNHELVILVTANDGQTLELPTRIVIDSQNAIDAGMPAINRHYRTWLENRAAGTNGKEQSSVTDCVSLEIIVPVRGHCEEELEVLATSIKVQTYRNWHLTLIVADDVGETAAALAADLAAGDERICYQASKCGDDADALNAVIESTSAPWVAVLWPGLILSVNALAEIACAASSHDGATVIYTDEDRVDPARAERWNPFFKPDWSPDLLLSMSYFGPLTFFSREKVLVAGGLRRGLPGAEIYDLALRVTELDGEVIHIADVLVTTIDTAPAGGESWHASDWRDAERFALVDALQRRGIAGNVEPGRHPGSWRIRYAMPEPPGVTVVLPTGGKMELLRACLEDLLHNTNYPGLEILIVDNSRGEDVARFVAELSLKHRNVRRIVDERTPFNYSALINAAVPYVTTPYILVFNDDINAIEPDWLLAMMEHAQRTEVGIVGAKLLYSDGTIQHAGVVLGPFDGSVHVYKRLQGDDPGYLDLPDVVRNCSAVTFACAVIDHAVFEAIGGLDEENFPVAFNDTDFCLRAREAGFEVVYTPHAALYHHESLTKTVIAHPHEIAYLRERWGHVIDHDPYYNPNLTRQGEDARLNMEPVRVA